MRNKKLSIFNLAKKTCTKKVRVCTIKFCAEGCLSENYDDEDIVCLENADITFTDGCRKSERRNSICICDDHIIAFETLK